MSDTFENDSDDDEDDFVEMPMNRPLRQVPPPPPPPSPPVREEPGARPITPPFHGAEVLQFPRRGGVGETATNQNAGTVSSGAQPEQPSPTPPGDTASASTPEEPAPAVQPRRPNIWPMLIGIAMIAIPIWIDARMRRDAALLAGEYESEE